MTTPNHSNPISYEVFVDSFAPKENFISGSGEYQFGVSASEMAAVREAHELQPGTVWTVFEDTIESGFSLVNALGYMITDVAVHGFLSVDYFDEDEDEDEDDEDDAYEM